MSTTIYVEGGGDGNDLRAACRRGFAKFTEKAGMAGQMPKIVACGGRQNAYDRFKDALSKGDGAAMLLVDSEGPVTAQGPWDHLKERDDWDRPGAAAAGQCHLMVQVMETWFLADVSALQSHYGQGFRPQDLPQSSNIESVPKLDVLSKLDQAAKNTKKGSYKKGSDSFTILENLDPGKVRQASGYADRLILALIG